MDQDRIPAVDVLSEVPCPVLYFEVPGLADQSSPPFDDVEFLMSLPIVGGPMLLSCEHRAVSLDRLPYILETGIDVKPMDAPLFAGPFVKAWEYGGAPKVIQILDSECLKRSWREVAADGTTEEIDAVRLQFPRVITLPYDGTLICSKLPPGDPRMGTAYEIAYGYSVVGDPFRALEAILIAADPLDPARKDVLAALKARVSTG